MSCAASCMWRTLLYTVHYQKRPLLAQAVNAALDYECAAVFDSLQPRHNCGFTRRSQCSPTGSACACCTYRPTLCRNCGFTRHLSCSPTGFGMFMSHVPPYTLPELRLHSAFVMPADRLRHAHVARTALHPAGITASLSTRHARRQASVCARRICRPAPCQHRGFTRRSPYPPPSFDARRPPRPAKPKARP